MCSAPPGSSTGTSAAAVTAPQKWTGYPVPPGPWLPSGCPDRLDGRRAQAGALYGSAALLLAALVVVVVRAPSERISR